LFFDISIQPRRGPEGYAYGSSSNISLQ
jgi:hypothetical protein